MSHAGFSYRKIGPFAECSYEAIRQWFHRLKYLFERHSGADKKVVYKAKIEIHGGEVYVWATVDWETLEVLHIDVSLGRSKLDALLFLKDVFKQCRGCPLLRTNCGLWYD